MEGEMSGLWRACYGAVAAVFVLALASGAARAQLMIVGNDEKITFGADGKPVPHEPGHDTLSVIDMSKPAAPRIVATIPLDNSIVGPPTNLAVSPSRDIALVANSVTGVAKEGSFTTVSDDRLFVIDLKASPPAAAATLNLGKKPSGLAINPPRTLPLLSNPANRT